MSRTLLALLRRRSLLLRRGVVFALRGTSAEELQDPVHLPASAGDVAELGDREELMVVDLADTVLASLYDAWAAMLERTDIWLRLHALNHSSGQLGLARREIHGLLAVGHVG